MSSCITIYLGRSGRSCGPGWCTYLCYGSAFAAHPLWMASNLLVPCSWDQRHESATRVSKSGGTNTSTVGLHGTAEITASEHLSPYLTKSLNLFLLYSAPCEATWHSGLCLTERKSGNVFWYRFWMCPRTVSDSLSQRQSILIAKVATSFAKIRRVLWDWK